MKRTVIARRWVCLVNKSESSFKNFWGPDEIKPHVEFSRKGIHYCVYCGEVSDTREHAPSKAFLNKPYPTDLPVLPACRKCNNSFSGDEQYVAYYIESLEYLAEIKNLERKRNIEKIMMYPAFSEAQADWIDYNAGKRLCSNPKIERVLIKLAVCHMVYELSEGYNTNAGCIEPQEVVYSFRFDMTDAEINEYDSFIFMDDKQVPIVGSRVFDKIYVLESVVEESNDSGLKKIATIVMDWTDIQENSYKYIAWLENDGTFHVRIVIHNFLFAELVFDSRE